MDNIEKLYFETGGIKVKHEYVTSGFTCFHEQCLTDKITIDNERLKSHRSTMFENTKSIVKLNKITDDDNEMITNLKITLAEYEFLQAKINLENYLKLVMSDTLKHIENMYISTDNIQDYKNIMDGNHSAKI